jgi:hypothetical protein
MAFPGVAMASEAPSVLTKAEATALRHNVEKHAEIDEGWRGNLSRHTRLPPSTNNTSLVLSAIGPVG